MRTPWQVIRGFVSRSKSDKAGETADELPAIPDPPVEAFEQHNRPQLHPEAQPDNGQANTEVTGSDRQRASVGATPRQALLAIQANPLPVTPPSQPIDGGADRATSIIGSKRHGAKAVQAREKLGKTVQRKTAADQPITAKENAVDEAAVSDDEIKMLRLQLCAKLFEQNNQLRRMIARYNDR